MQRRSPGEESHHGHRENGASRGRDRRMCWTAAHNVEGGQRYQQRQPLGRMSLCGALEVT